MIRKRYRLQIDFDMMIHDATAERCATVRERGRESRAGDDLPLVPEDISENPSQEDLDSTQALMDEIMKDPDLFLAWMSKNVLLYAEDAVAHAIEGTQRVDQILHPAVERLPPRARHWWRQTFGAEDDDTAERVVYLFDVLSCHARRPTVFEVDLGG